MPLGGHEGRLGGWDLFQRQELQGAQVEQEKKKKKKETVKMFVFSMASDSDKEIIGDSLPPLQL